MAKVTTKAVFTTFLTILMLTVLISCTSENTETVYFIHAACVKKSGDNIKAYFLTQKQSPGEKTKFITLEADGESLSDAAKKLSDKYKECYFATNKLYIIPKDADVDFIKSFSAILDSGLLPSACHVVCTDEKKMEEIFNGINDTASLKNLLTKSGYSLKKRSTAIMFLSDVLSSEKHKEIICITPHDGNILREENSVLPAANMERTK